MRASAPMHHIPLFWAGVRVSTWAMLLLFANLALYRRSWRPLLAAFIWMIGFEAAWQVTLYVVRGYPGPLWGGIIPRVVVMVAVGVPTVLFAARRGLRPNRMLMVLVGGVWIVWIATGFHSNIHSLVRINATGEVMNETAKTLWAFAYYWPLLHRSRGTRPELQTASA